MCPSGNEIIAAEDSIQGEAVISPSRLRRATAPQGETVISVDATLAMLMWMKWLEEKNNETFLPLFRDQHKHLILKGGGGSGKSIWAGWKVYLREILPLPQ